MDCVTIVKTPSLSAPVGEASERRRSTPMGNWPSETSPIEKYVIGDSPMKLIIYWVSGQKSLSSRASPMKNEEKFSPMEFKGAVIYQAGYPPGVDMAGV